MAKPNEIFRFIGRSGKRAAITIAGGTVLAAGIFFLIVPGPGIPLIIGGLAILATEYTWARRTLDRAKGEARKVRSRLRDRRAARRAAKAAEKTAREKEPPASGTGRG